jgi:hypothetical protein
MSRRGIAAMVKRSLLAGVLLAQAGCIVDLDDCGPMTRSTQVEGEFREGPTVLVDAAIELVEFRNGSSVLHPVIFGPRDARGAPLRDHVLAARLVDADETLHTFPLASAPLFGDEIIGATNTEPANPSGVRLVLLAGRAALELESDLPGYELVVVPLPIVIEGDWDRASCS